MNVQLNHTIVWCHDKHASSAFLVDILGLPNPAPFGPMLVVELSNSVSLDFYESEGKIAMQHYAFLIEEEDFDGVFAHLKEKGIQHWADPGQQKPDEIYHHNGGRGLYFEDPDGHLLEIMTQPYANEG